MPLDERQIYKVSQLNQTARLLLESHFAQVWVEGEISNFSRPASGHWYFSLKDDQAQVRCAMFRNRNQALNFSLKDGMHVLLRAKVSLYEGRGDYQLIVEYLEETGDGALKRAFEILKQKLAAEGLFNEAIKKPLPKLPRCIGIVTSPTGAAIRDILSVIQRRFPLIPVIIYPTEVQGKTAGSKIVEAIQIANQRQECDVLILARGGGSLEDLWSFNEEIVARAIHASILPIVSGVGHEIDFTIADFVADRRAPTPSAAAELVTPNQTEWLDNLRSQQQRLWHGIKQVLLLHQQNLLHLTKRLRHPASLLQEKAQRLDTLQLTLNRIFEQQLQRWKMQLKTLHEKLLRENPARVTHTLLLEQNLWLQRLQQAMKNILERKQQQLESFSYALDAMSPLATLSRGYSILTQKDGTILRSIKQVSEGDLLDAKLVDGKMKVEVIKCSPDE
ncbi:MAG: exodeoxyribonuclease VII large subunit [Proteobacteria bacterium]|nr:exodeoxyribonuclease VII large subunit [Pseudomonadota bacterium]